MTGFAKTNLIGTYIYIYIYIYTEIYFLSVDKSHIHALSKDSKHLRLDVQAFFYWRLFSDTVNPQGCISWPVWPLRGINKTVWCAKLILTADLASPVSCASLAHLLMGQHCHWGLSACFSPPTAPHPPQPPLQCLYKPLIRHPLRNFLMLGTQFNSHPLRTEHNWSPKRIWFNSMISQDHQLENSEEIVDLEVYEIDYGGPLPE